ncbi:MAG: energy transducer TonB [Alcanivoracaceae bacterium]|jgi:periplasmic protein TonB|nr:energy transducer TonB [Alcanivoracaceae bacterium]
MAAATTVSAADRLSFMLFLALAFHAVLILGLGFAPEDPGAAARTIEVTIAQQLSETEPEDADFIAQANQQASGDLDEKREVTTTEQSPFDSQTIAQVNLQSPSTLNPDPAPVQRVTLTTQGVSSRKAPVKVDKPTPPKPLPKSNRESDAAMSEEIASLQARLDAQKQAYAKRPRVHHLTSVSAKAHYEALYLDSFRRAVEEIGTRNFPQKALNEGIFGNVRLAVQLKPNGSVDKIEVTLSSGHRFLDEAAIQSVRLAAPFAPFPDEMRQNVDILEIIRTWRFDSRERLTSH